MHPAQKRTASLQKTGPAYGQHKRSDDYGQRPTKKSAAEKGLAERAKLKRERAIKKAAHAKHRAARKKTRLEKRAKHQKGIMHTE